EKANAGGSYFLAQGAAVEGAASGRRLFHRAAEGTEPSGGEFPRDRQNHRAPPVSLAPRTAHAGVQSLRAHGRRSRISSGPSDFCRRYFPTPAGEKTR